MEEVKKVKQLTDYSKEELIKGIRNLADENEALKNVISELGETRFMQRLEFLFKILDNEKMFSPEQLNTVADEIWDSLYPKEDNKEEK